jgi:amino acid permease
MNSSSVIFNWLLRFVTTSGYISWLSSCMVYRCFRRQVKRNAITPRYRFAIQPMGTSFGILASTALLVFGGLNAVGPSTAAESRTVRAITTYAGIPVFVLLYVGHRVHSRAPPKTLRWAGNNRADEPVEDEDAGVDVVASPWPRKVNERPLNSFEMQEHPRMVEA